MICVLSQAFRIRTSNVSLSCRNQSSFNIQVFVFKTGARKIALNGCLPSKSSGSVTGFLTCHLAVKSEDCDRLGQLSSLRKGFKYRPQGCGPGVSVTVGEMADDVVFYAAVSAGVFARLKPPTLSL